MSPLSPNIKRFHIQWKPSIFNGTPFFLFFSSIRAAKSSDESEPDELIAKCADVTYECHRVAGFLSSLLLFSLPLGVDGWKQVGGCQSTVDGATSLSGHERGARVFGERVACGGAGRKGPTSPGTLAKPMNQLLRRINNKPTPAPHGIWNNQSHACFVLCKNQVHIVRCCYVNT